jgi:hypothetical protein
MGALKFQFLYSYVLMFLHSFFQANPVHPVKKDQSENRTNLEGLGINWGAYWTNMGALGTNLGAFRTNLRAPKTNQLRVSNSISRKNYIFREFDACRQKKIRIIRLFGNFC